MAKEDVALALESLQGERAEEVERGVSALRDRLALLPEPEFRAAVEGLCALFYVDAHDRPDLEPSLERTVQILAAAGPRVVCHLLEFMRGSDLKSHLYLARTLAVVGQPALAALRRVIATEDAYSRSFALFALGKIRHPEVCEAFPEVLASLTHPDKEVRDSAARTLGKLAETVPTDLLSGDQRSEIFDALFRTLADHQPAVRAKAMRSLGKVVRAGYLKPEQEDRVGLAARRLLGQDEQHEWDRAYVVRLEAQEALRHVVARARGSTP